MKSVKLLLVGDEEVGKSSLIKSYINSYVSPECVTRLLDNYVIDVVLGDETVRITLSELAIMEACANLWSVLHSHVDVFIFCFSIDNRASLRNIESKWMPRISYQSPHATTFLVGCKSDLRHSDSTNCIDLSEILDISKKLKIHYFETSALTDTGVQDCFDIAVGSQITATGIPKKKKTFMRFKGLFNHEERETMTSQSLDLRKKSGVNFTDTNKIPPFTRTNENKEIENIENENKDSEDTKTDDKEIEENKLKDNELEITAF